MLSTVKIFILTFNSVLHQLSICDSKSQIFCIVFWIYFFLRAVSLCELHTLSLFKPASLSLSFCNHAQFSITTRIASNKKFYVGLQMYMQCKECRLLIHSGHTKWLEMLVTVLPNVMNEHLLFVIVFKLCKRCSVWRKLVTEQRLWVQSSEQN